MYDSCKIVVFTPVVYQYQYLTVALQIAPT